MVRMVSTVGALVAGVLALSGCVSAAEASPATMPVGRYSTPGAAVPLTSTTTYLVTMRGLLAGQERSDQTDAELITSGRAVCANEVAAGMTWESLDEMIRAWGLSGPLYRAYVQAAVTAFCPGEM